MINATQPRAHRSQEARPLIDRPPGSGSPSLNVLGQFGTSLVVEHNGEIYSQGDSADHCWQVLSGCVREVKIFEDGRRAVSRFLFAGSYFGFEDKQPREFSAEAVTDVELQRFPLESWESLVGRSPTVALELRRLTLDDLRQARAHVLALGRQSAAERVVAFIVEMARRFSEGQGQMVPLPMSRIDIADHLGLTVETVCRTLHLLNEKGLLVIRRGGVEVRSISTLHRRVARICDHHRSHGEGQRHDMLPRLSTNRFFATPRKKVCHERS